jgi:GAF domain-containing protein
MASDLEKRLAEARSLLQARDRELADSLDQQAATSEILRAISSSPRDVQPVFDAIAKSAARLCQAVDVSIFRVEGDRLAFVAHHGPIAQRHGEFSLPLGRGTVGGRSVLESRTVQVADLQNEADEFPEAVENARRFGFRAILSVPLLREGVAIGGIQLRRTEAQLFSARQVELLQTFADQAVIAIENVRLFTETQEALEQQTATAEILRVISSSPTDVQPVFDTIVRSATQLCGADFGAVHRFDGTLLHLAAHYNVTPEGVQELHRLFPRPLDEGSISARVLRDGRPHQNPDVQADADTPLAAGRMGRMLAYRSEIVVPLLRGATPIGTLSIARRAGGLFPDKQVELLQTFADQAVIAIENVRLFTELQQKNHALSEALEQQTATSAILRAMSGSLTDAQPVFDTIVRSGLRLLGGYSASMMLLRDAETLDLVAYTSTSAEADASLAHAFPMPLRSLPPGERAVRERRPHAVEDVVSDPDVSDVMRTTGRTRGWHGNLFIPMIREDVALGLISITRREPGPFAPDEIALLETFADQAVIAIENARLFTELQEKNRALSEALEQQTATSEILRTISQSQTDVQPVFDAIVGSAQRLCGAIYGVIYRVDGELIHAVAHAGFTPEQFEGWRRTWPRSISEGGVTGTAIRSRSIVRLPDIEAETHVGQTAETWANVRARGARSVVVIPMFHGGGVIGAIGLTHSQVGAFSDTHVELLQTFAQQAVIAIENARLFTELQTRTEELTRSVGQLTALGEVGQAVSSSLDLETVLTTIISRAVQLSGLDGGTVFEYDETSEELRQRATTGTSRVLAGRAVVRKGEGVIGQVAVTLEPVQVSDIRVAGAYESRFREGLLEAGVCAIIAVPIVREGRLLGGFAVNRHTPGEFPPETVDLLRTFATQSALPIQNARLFREIADKSAQLEAASRHKSEFLANMSHELRTPLNAIIGFSEVLGERMFGELNDKQAEYMKDIHASGQHLLSLINDILDLSKIEAGRMELEVSDFDLPSAIENALILVRERAGRRGIALGSAIDPTLGAIRGDERKVKQVLLNLLSNALKFTPEGGRIDVRAATNDGMAELSVTDTGVGIAPEDQAVIFEEFRQVGAADKRVEGTGLGLALSRKFIELHGGRIWVTSQVGAGSTFAFTLPVTGRPS